MQRGWTQTDYQNKHYSINQKDEGTQDDRGRDGGTNFILRIKEQETHLTLQEHDDDDEICSEYTQGEGDNNMSGFVSCRKVVLLNWRAASFSAGMPYQITIVKQV